MSECWGGVCRLRFESSLQKRQNVGGHVEKKSSR